MLKRILQIILLLPICISAQHGAFISPVVKYSHINSQPAVIFGGKAGWNINNTFIIGGAFYSLGSNINQHWSDPASNNTPYLWFNTGGLNLEYFIYRAEPFSFSLEMFLGGGAVKLRPRDESKPYTDMYGGDLLFFEPQLNATYNFNEWLHLSLGVSYRHSSGFDVYPQNTDPNAGFISIKDLRGTSATLSLVFGMY